MTVKINGSTFEPKSMRQKTLRIQYVLHASYEPLGIIENWAKSKGHVLNGYCPFEGDRFPEEMDFDMLVVMGGPQSACELDRYPYLKEEIALISRAIAHHKIVLGFCLGAQLIGEALGAKTSRSPEKEVGMFPITLTEAGTQDPIFKDFPETFNVFHWHNDMPGLSQEAVILAASEGCPRQVIRFGDRIYGFQCHLEPKLENAMEMLVHGASELTPGKFIQSSEQILKGDYALLNQRMMRILDTIVSL